MSSLQIPDLRLEQSFLRSLRVYAQRKEKGKYDQLGIPHFSGDKPDLFSKQLDEEEQEILAQTQEGILPPLSSVLPSIVTYAIIKDHIIMPFLQGFMWAGFLLAVRPYLNAVFRHGRQWGVRMSRKMSTFSNNLLAPGLRRSK